jgi:outer membrane receptor for ferrienterochelin and colicins
MFRLALILLLSVLTFSWATAQTGTLKGTCLVEGMPEAGLQIRLGDTLEALTDEKGLFSFTELGYGTYTLRIYSEKEEWYKTRITLKDTLLHLDTLFIQKAENILEPLVITGSMREVKRSDSPVPIEVYSEKFLKRNPAPTLFESLQNINGVRPQLNCNVCNTGDIHINGLEGPYTMVLIDGMPIVSGLSTVYGLNGIPRALIDRMEVIKGPASTLYGSEAVGGVINVVTKNPNTAPLASVDLMATSWSEWNLDVGMRFRMGTKVNTLVGVTYFRYQTPIDRNGDGFTDITLSERISVFNKWAFQRKEKRIASIAGRIVLEDRWGGQMKWTPQFKGGDSLYGESIQTQRWELMGTYALPVKADVRFQVSANGHFQDSYYGQTYFKANQNIWFGQLLWFKKLGSRHHLLSGLVYRFTFYDDNTTATNPASRRPLPGAFIQDEWKLNASHTLLAGMRMDYDEVHGIIPTPRLNYKWTSASGRTTSRLSYGSGFRVANVFTEDHAALTGAREVIFLDDLAPERSQNVNWNVVQNLFVKSGTRLTVDGTLFYTYFENRIIADYDANPNAIIYDNLDGFAESKGFSLNLEYASAKTWKAWIGGTFVNVATIEDGVRTQPVLTEKTSAVWSLSYTIPKVEIVLDYTGNLYGPMRLPLLGPLDDRAEYSPWWSLQNIQISKAWKRLEVYGGIKNVLNYTPPSNSIARPFDPFDKQVMYNTDGSVMPTSNNPNALSFDPTYVFAPNQGRRIFMGLRWTIQ